MRTDKIILLACLSAFAHQAVAADAPVAAPAAAAAPRPAALAVSVNGVAIPALYIDIVRNDLQQRRRPAGDKQVADILIENELLAQEAVSRGLDKRDEVKALLDLQRKDALGKVLIDDYIKGHPIAEERIMAEYEQIKAKTGEKEYHAWHILVDNEKQAKDFIAQLKNRKPGQFAALAKKHSKDPGSAKVGGDLGWMAPGSLVPEFSAAMIALKKGEISQAPVKTQFGWHVILLQDERKVDFPEYDKVKGRIASQLLQQEVRKYLLELRSSAKIDVTGLVQ